MLEDGRIARLGRAEYVLTIEGLAFLQGTECPPELMTEETETLETEKPSLA